MRLDPSVWPTKQKCATVSQNIFSPNQINIFTHKPIDSQRSGRCNRKWSEISTHLQPTCFLKFLFNYFLLNLMVYNTTSMHRWAAQSWSSCEHWLQWFDKDGLLLFIWTGWNSKMAPPWPGSHPIGYANARNRANTNRTSKVSPNNQQLGLAFCRLHLWWSSHNPKCAHLSGLL